MKIVIVGGGVIGCTLAYFLVHSEDFNKEEDQVIVIEEGQVAAAASGKAGGFLASNWCEGEDIDDLCHLSFSLHEELAKKLNGVDAYDYRRVDTISCLVANKMSSTNDDRNGVPGWIGAKVHQVHSIGTKATNAQVHPRKFTETMLKHAVSSGHCQFMN